MTFTALVHGEQLDRDVPLIVIHRHDRVELRRRLRARLIVSAGSGPVRSSPSARPLSTAGRMIVDSSSPKRPSSPACGLSAQMHRRAAAIPSALASRATRAATCAARRRSKRGQRLRDGHVQSDVHDCESASPRHTPRAQVEHHREVIHAAQLGQQFGVAGIVMARFPERAFVQQAACRSHRSRRPAPSARAATSAS